MGPTMSRDRGERERFVARGSRRETRFLVEEFAGTRPPPALSQAVSSAVAQAGGGRVIPGGL
jgi:hypothetical protein